jgi:hypothetical protein
MPRRKSREGGEGGRSGEGEQQGAGAMPELLLGRKRKEQGEKKKRRRRGGGAALLRHRPMQLKPVVAPLVHQPVVRPAGRPPEEGTPCWSRSGRPAMEDSGAARLRRPPPKPEPSVDKSPLHRAEPPCFLFTELFAASPGRQGAGLLHKGDVDVKPWTAPPCFLCSRPFRCSSPPPRRRVRSAR